jgi:hypothetical protein
VWMYCITCQSTVLVHNFMAHLRREGGASLKAELIRAVDNTVPYQDRTRSFSIVNCERFFYRERFQTYE